MQLKIQKVYKNAYYEKLLVEMTLTDGNTVTSFEVEIAPKVLHALSGTSETPANVWEGEAWTLTKTSSTSLFA